MASPLFLRGLSYSLYAVTISFSTYLFYFFHSTQTFVTIYTALLQLVIHAIFL